MNLATPPHIFLYKYLLVVVVSIQHIVMLASTIVVTSQILEVILGFLKKSIHLSPIFFLPTMTSC